LLPQWRKFMLVRAVVYLVILAHPVILYWGPLMEWRTVARLRRNPQLQLAGKRWTPSRYHAWYGKWAEKLHLPVPAVVWMVNASGPSIADTDLIGLNVLRDIEDVNLTSTQITDDGLVHLTGLVNLEVLVLDQTYITDKGLAHLKGLTNLRVLSIRQTNITDKGLAQLEGMKALLGLHLTETRVTGGGCSSLQAALPQVTIYTSSKAGEAR
jgi:hypothetical protein